MSTFNPNFGFGVGGYGAGRYGNAPIVILPLGYYLNLLTSEYRTSTKLNAWLYQVLAKIQDISYLMVSYSGAFDLANARGVQLDTLGVIVGQSRTVDFQPTGGVSPILDDATYRILLQAKIFNNQWDGLLGSLQTFWQGLFPGGSIAIQDNMNMTANVIVYGSFTSIIVDLINHGYLVPRPQAVQYTYVEGTFPLFGVDQNNSFIAGMDTGHIT
jgi:Protein of unknown function (DUF2612)